ncbi:hypothetical protein [Hansschlegelia zhihuaiae]|uniref:Uncharacterized protein n=1 Tax=Hansschlegelia zhihuaiae TaxID=405005 RepID=A0A4V1KJL3_9HYPH|nr:hypothetical protein [Hansschlegelia zhihuaiae]RXF74592.1 hypothetical protein EK403_04110 [Hansschlegelia zhihuaiae]
MIVRALIAAALLAASAGAASAGVDDDYPTAEKADYIFACMAANGQTRESLERCSCSIDTIATILPYTEYEEAETVLRMDRVAGQASELFRTSADLKDKVANMRRAQAEAEVKCF